VFSVVVPTYNRAALLLQVLRSLAAQRTEAPFEVIVVDNGSTARTREVVAAFPSVRYVRETRPGSSAARNAGIATARGEVIAFLDDDVVAEPDWLEALRCAYAALPDAWCIGGRVTLRLPDSRPPWLDPPTALLAAYLSEQDLGEGTVPIVYPRALISANLSVKREALERVGGFAQDLGRFGGLLLSGEDLELCWRIQRAGGGVYYCGRASVSHLIPPERLTKPFFRRRAYWQGRTEAVFSRRYGVTGQLLKDALKAGWLYAAQDGRRAFEHELAAWKGLGYLLGRLHRNGMIVGRKR
jgi:GT2 family glycosyltransferase